MYENRGQGNASPPASQAESLGNRMRSNETDCRIIAAEQITYVVALKVILRPAEAELLLTCGELSF